MPHPALDAVTGDCVSNRPLTTKPMRGPDRLTGCLLDATSSGACAAWTISVGLLARSPRLVVLRKSFELCILSNRGNTVVVRARMSGGQAGAALAAPGGNDGAAGAGPHPQTKAVGTAATPVARLKSALAHGKLHHLRGTRQSGTVLTRHASQSERAGGSRRCKRPSNGTGRRQTGQTGANLGDLRNSGRRCPVDTPNTMANIADPLASHPRDC